MFVLFFPVCMAGNEGALSYDQFVGRPTFDNPLSHAIHSLSQKIRKKQDLQDFAPVEKPRVDLFYWGNEARVQLPRLAITYWEMYELSYMCAAMSAAQIKLRDEIFRHKGKFKPKFQRRCTACQATYEKNIPRQSIPGPEDPVTGLPGAGEDVEHCTKCNSTGTLVPPDDSELFWIQKLFREMNTSGQDVWDLLKQFEDDVNITDDGWLVAIPEYKYDTKTGQLYWRPKEIVRGHPNIMRIVADGKGTRGGAFLSCPAHRSFVYNLRTVSYSDDSRTFRYDHKEPVDWKVAPKFCPHCLEQGRKVELRDVWYVATEAGSQKPVAYYFKEEVLHVSRYRPGSTYGTSPCVTLYREARSLIKMEEYIQEYFEKRMIPRGMVVIRRSTGAPTGQAVTPPQKKVEEFKSDVQRNLQETPHDIPFVGISHADDIQFIAFADKINEMEYIPVREEFKRNIASFYGLSPLFMAQTEESGGMNNESQQITVTNRSLESSQNMYNEKVFPWLLEICSVKSYKYELEKPEQRDKISGVQYKLAQVELAMGFQDLGFEVLGWDPVNEEFIISEKPNPELQAAARMPATGHLGDESEGMTYKPHAPKEQGHSGEPQAQRRGANP